MHASGGRFPFWRTSFGDTAQREIRWKQPCASFLPFQLCTRGLTLNPKPSLGDIRASAGFFVQAFVRHECVSCIPHFGKCVYLAGLFFRGSTICCGCQRAMTQFSYSWGLGIQSVVVGRRGFGHETLLVANQFARSCSCQRRVPGLTRIPQPQQAVNSEPL